MARLCILSDVRYCFIPIKPIKMLTFSGELIECFETGINQNLWNGKDFLCVALLIEFKVRKRKFFLLNEVSLIQK